LMSSSSAPLQFLQCSPPAPDQHELPTYHELLASAIYSTELIVKYLSILTDRKFLPTSVSYFLRIWVCP
jgi:hypothetical protein